MSELLREQASAFCDDALSAEESALLIRRLHDDEQLKKTFACYQLIGASIRREPDASTLAERVRMALGEERLLPARRAMPWHSMLRPAVGLALAAAVAVVAITGVRLSEPEGGAPGRMMSAATEPSTYVVPQSTDASNQSVGKARLASYVMRHGNYATMPNPPVMNFRGVGQHSTAAVAPAPEQPEAPPEEPEGR
jgi:negative regulator of sigma E activity